jgi:hypothetical protein
MVYRVFITVSLLAGIFSPPQINASPSLCDLLVRRLSLADFKEATTQYHFLNSLSPDVFSKTYSANTINGLREILSQQSSDGSWEASRDVVETLIVSEPLLAAPWKTKRWWRNRGLGSEGMNFIYELIGPKFGDLPTASVITLARIRNALYGRHESFQEEIRETLQNDSPLSYFLRGDVKKLDDLVRAWVEIYNKEGRGMDVVALYVHSIDLVKSGPSSMDSVLVPSSSHQP